MSNTTLKHLFASFCVGKIWHMKVCYPAVAFAKLRAQFLLRWVPSGKVRHIIVSLIRTFAPLLPLVLLCSSASKLFLIVECAYRNSQCVVKGGGG